jgi:hypothetical protein
MFFFYFLGSCLLFVKKKVLIYFLKPSLSFILLFKIYFQNKIEFIISNLIFKQDLVTSNYPTSPPCLR